VRKGSRKPATPCLFDGCESPARGLGFCHTHYQRLRTHGDPSIVNDRLREQNPRWRSGPVSYNTMHARLKAQRGPASRNTCEHCGAQAAQWAYDHADPSSRFEDRSDARYKAGVRRFEYSLDVGHYLALCSPCHRAFDIKHSPRHNAAKTHCPQGHPYDEANTGFQQRSPTNRGRRCRKCNAARQRARKQALRSAQGCGTSAPISPGPTTETASG
jgi:hypothetical protein